MEYLGGRLEIVEGDITRLEVDGIVNAANRSLLGGGGVDGAIHRAAGPRLLEGGRGGGGGGAGRAESTAGYGLPAGPRVHAVGPVWRGGKSKEDELLAGCYVKSLELARENRLESVAFPSISTGVYGFPVERAARIALVEIAAFLKGGDMPQKVICCTFGKRDYDVYVTTAGELFGG